MPATLTRRATLSRYPVARGSAVAHLELFRWCADQSDHIGNVTACHQAISSGLHIVTSGCRDLNPGPLDPQSSALTKLRHSPFLFRATFCPVSCDPIRSVSSKSKFIALLAQSGRVEAYSDSESAPTATCVYVSAPPNEARGVIHRQGSSSL
jgi:hypothetical protein